jgi:hypothetical protein
LADGEGQIPHSTAAIERDFHAMNGPLGNPAVAIGRSVDVSAGGTFCALAIMAESQAAQNCAKDRIRHNFRCIGRGSMLLNAPC